MEYKKRLDLTLAVSIFPFKMAQARYWMCMKENVLASMWLSVNSIYIAKIKYLYRQNMKGLIFSIQK